MCDVQCAVCSEQCAKTKWSEKFAVCRLEQFSVQKSGGARLAVPYRRESREGQLVEGDCVGGQKQVEGARGGG